MSREHMCHDSFWGVAAKISKTTLCAMTHLRRYQRQYQDIKDGHIKHKNMCHDSFWQWPWRYQRRRYQRQQYVPWRGWSLRKKRKKQKDFSFLFGTQSKARAGWPTRLRLVRATPWADFAVITTQLWSTITAIFSRVNNFAFNCYLRPRSWDYCQMFYSMQVSFRFHSLRTLWDALRHLYLRISAQRFEPGGLIEQRRFRITFLGDDQIVEWQTNKVKRERQISVVKRPQKSAGLELQLCSFLLKMNLAKKTDKIWPPKPHTLAHAEIRNSVTRWDSCRIHANQKRGKEWSFSDCLF